MDAPVPVRVAEFDEHRIVGLLVAFKVTVDTFTPTVALFVQPSDVEPTTE